MDINLQFAGEICYICKTDSEHLYDSQNTIAIQKTTKSSIDFNIILRGSRLCYKCLNSLKSKVKSQRVTKCEKCYCLFEYRDCYLQEINHINCPICGLRLSQCWKHKHGEELFVQNTRITPCYLCCSIYFLKQLITNILLFLASPLLIFFTGIEGVDQWPCWFQAFFFIFLPFTFPFAVVYIIIQKFLAIFYTLLCLLSLFVSKGKNQTIWSAQHGI